MSLDHLALLDAGFIVGDNKMIARDSKSYPYLAIAQHYNIPYAEVLRFSETLDNLTPFNNIAWQWEVYDLEKVKRK